MTWYTNADSLNNKMDELKQRIQGATKKPEIIVITEVKLKNRRVQHNEAEFNIEGYEIFSTKLQSDSGRGIIMYTESSMCVNEVNINSDFNECLAIQIKLQRNKYVYIYAVYRSPNSDENNNTKLNEMIESIAETNRSDFVIIGDLNYPDINWETGMARLSSTSQAFADTTRDNFLYQKVTQPTRQRSQDRPSLLDLILVSEEELVEDIQYESPLGLSDHSMLTFNISGIREAKDQKIRKFFLQKADYNQIREALDCDWYEVLNHKGNGVDQMWKSFEELVTKVQLDNIPNKEVNPAKKKSGIFLWTKKLWS